MPTAAAAAPATRCPRCAAPVTGAYKFCPACAYRLHTDLPDAEVPPRSPWKGRLVGVGLVATFFLAAALGGVVVLRPGTEPPPPRTPTTLSYETPAFTVADIPDQLVELAPWGYVGSVEPNLVRGLSPEDRERLESEQRGVAAAIHYAFRAMPYEVTQGQYEEFLQDVEEHPELIADLRGLWWWERSDGNPDATWPEAPTNVELLHHVPRAWLIRDERGRPTGWSREESRTPSRNLPVTDVSFYDAAAFARWAARRLDLPNLTLPVHAEWMRAARSGKLQIEKWPWGDRLYRFALNHAGTWGAGVGQPQPVHWRYHEPTEGPHAGGRTSEGLYAMAGNVWEWASGNSYSAYFPPAGTERLLALWDPLTHDQDKAVACGGSFRYGIDDCQIESSQTLYKGDRRPDIGFRLVEALRAR